MTSPGGQHAFVTKLNPTGTALVYSTYLRGSFYDIGNHIAVDSSGNAYVTGGTGSTDFPTVNPIQPTLAGEEDAFVTEVNATGTSLIFSTFLGGSGNEIGTGIAVDPSGNAYVAGQTNSTNFPTTPGAFQTSVGVAGVTTGFFTKINPSSAPEGYVFPTPLTLGVARKLNQLNP